MIIVGNEFKACNLKVSSVLDMLNHKLKSIYAKPIVPKQGAIGYDKVNGRYVQVQRIFN